MTDSDANRDDIIDLLCFASDIKRASPIRDTPNQVYLSRTTMPSQPNNTQITLHGMTTLRNRREQPGKANVYIYDGLFSCAEATGDNDDGVGSFRHYVGKNKRLKQDGTYEVHAKVY